MDELAKRKMDRSADKGMDEWMEWVGRLMGRWRVIWMDGWMDHSMMGRLLICIQTDGCLSGQWMDEWIGS